MGYFLIIFLTFIYSISCAATNTVQVSASVVGEVACSGWYGEGDTDSPGYEGQSTDIAASPFTTTCTGTPTGARVYNSATETPDDSVIVFAYGDTDGSGPDTSDLLFTSEEGDDQNQSPGWSATLTLSGASEIASGTKIWLCVWDENGAGIWYQAGTENYYSLANPSGYPTPPSSGTFTEGSSFDSYLIQITYD